MGVDHWDHFANTVGLVAFRPSQQVHDTNTFSFMACDEVVSDRTAAVANAENLRGVPRLQLNGLLQWPDHTWRTINPETMRLFDARVLYRHNELNAYFPVWMNRNYVGGVYAAVAITDADKEAGKLAYINTSGTWANDALFGYHLALRQRGWLWAVEGPRDTAKVCQLGGRVVGLLSAHVSAKKIRAIEALDPPGIIVALDPDAAGDRGRTKLHEAFDGRLPVLDVHYPEGKDPAKMTPAVYARILQRLGLSDGTESHRSQRPARRPQHRARESLGCQ